METPDHSVEELSRLRMTECQGTLIGGMVVAKGLGLSPEDFGYRMMATQKINWESLAGNLSKIARVFCEHYQITYGFGSRLEVTEEDDSLRLEMPSVAQAAAGQLAHWDAAPADFEAVQRGFWRALQQHAKVSVSLTFDSGRDVIIVQKR